MHRNKTHSCVQVYSVRRFKIPYIKEQEYEFLGAENMLHKA